MLIWFGYLLEGGSSSRHGVSGKTSWSENRVDLEMLYAIVWSRSLSLVGERGNCSIIDDLVLLYGSTWLIRIKH